MDRKDDIAAALPEPPPPAPARREAAIGAALRRFDGGVESGPRPSSRRPSPWARLSRPQLGTALAAMLVLLVGLPTAWMSIPDSSPPHKEVAPAASPDRRTPAAPAPEQVPDKRLSQPS